MNRYKIFKKAIRKHDNEYGTDHCDPLRIKSCIEFQFILQTLKEDA